MVLVGGMNQEKYFNPRFGSPRIKQSTPRAAVVRIRQTVVRKAEPKPT